MRRQLIRRGAVSIGILVLAAGCVWLAAGPVVGYLVESRLHAAGFPDASAAGVSLARGGADIARLRLDAVDEFVLDDVHLSVSTGGISGIGIGGLRLEARPGSGGDVTLPGLSAAGGGSSTDIVDLLPPEGITVERAEVRIAGPTGELGALLANVVIRHGAAGGATARADYVLEHSAAMLAGGATAVLARGGPVEAALTITDGSIAAAGLAAGPLAGAAEVRFGGAGSPVASLTLEAAQARITDFALGRLSMQASLREGLVELGLQSPSSDVVELAIDARARLPGGAHLEELTARAAFRSPASGELTLTLTDVSLGKVSASGRLALAGQGLAFPGVLRDGSIEAIARVEGNADLLRFAAAEPWTATLVPVAGIIPEPMRALAGQRASATITARDGDPLELAVALSSRSAEFSAAVALDAGPSRASAEADFAADWQTRFSIAANALRLDAEAVPWHDVTLGLEAEWSGLELVGPVDAGGQRWSAAVTGGALELPSSGIALRGIDGEAAFRQGALQSGELAVAAAESLAEPAWWTPMQIEVGVERADATAADATAADATAADATAADATGTEPTAADSSGSELAFDATISDERGVFVFEATGRVGDESGTADLMLYPIRFIEGATTIGDISPRLAASLADGVGTLAFEGRAAWSAAGVESSGMLELDDFGATVGGIPVTGVSTSTALSSLWPPATRAAQHVGIARVGLGVPLVDGIAVFDLDAGGRLAVQELEFDVAGGRLYAEPFTVDSVAEGDIRFTIGLENLELAQMLELSQIDGLDGTGVLSGSIPVRIADGGVRLDEGRLAAETDGSLRYTPDNLPAFLRGDDERTAILREVLTNFRYDELSVAVSGESGEGGRQTVRFDVAGANPDFLDGHPIELAFTFQGPLLGAMTSAVNVVGAAEIEEMFEQQQLSNRESTQ